MLRNVHVQKLEHVLVDLGPRGFFWERLQRCNAAQRPIQAMVATADLRGRTSSTPPPRSVFRSEVLTTDKGLLTVARGHRVAIFCSFELLRACDRPRGPSPGLCRRVVDGSSRKSNPPPGAETPRLRRCRAARHAARRKRLMSRARLQHVRVDAFWRCCPARPKRRPVAAPTTPTLTPALRAGMADPSTTVRQKAA